MVEVQLIPITRNLIASHLFSVFLLLTLAEFGCARQVDFEACYANNVTKLNNSDISDPMQNFKWDPTHTNRTHTNQTFLSLVGCTTLCHSGHQFYSASDIAWHTTLFLVPLVSLVGRFGFAPGGVVNVFWTIIHLLGDPIDSLWSILTRQERARRNYHIALQNAPGAARDVAAIWTAYDQWWQDPVQHFLEGIKSRSENPLVRERLLGEGYRPRRGETINPRNFTQASQESNTNVPDFVNNEQKYHIKTAVHNLAANRANHPIKSLIAIVFFVASLTAGYVHLATSHTNNDISHLIAVMTLFFFLTFAVYITGHVGTFRESKQVIDAVFNLHNRYKSLFPAPVLLLDAVESGGRISGSPQRQLSARSFFRKYDDVEAYSGLISSWRPRKHLKSENSSSDRGPVRLFIMSFLAVVTSWLGAFLLSYMTPVWGLGCRAASWTVILLAWIASAGIDLFAQWIAVDILSKAIDDDENKLLTRNAAKVLWYISMVKDLIFTMGILVLVFMSQVGYFNSCWCMASMFFRPASKMSDVCIDLGPLSQQDRDNDWIRWLVIPIATLLITHFIIFWAGWEGEGGRLLYIRTKTERVAEEFALVNMGKRLGIDDTSQSGHQYDRDSSNAPVNLSDQQARDNLAVSSGALNIPQGGELPVLPSSPQSGIPVFQPPPSSPPISHLSRSPRSSHSQSPSHRPRAPSSEGLLLPLDTLTLLSESHSRTNLLQPPT